jgi:hypothetical protein
MVRGSKVVTAAGGVLLLLGACSVGDGRSGADPESSPGTFEIKGTISVPSSTYVTSGGDQPGGFCTVKDGYEDLRTGASVAVTNADGDVVGVSSLVDIDRAASECRYSFEVPGVPDGSPSYGIEVGNRGVVEYARDELDDSVELPLDRS